MMLSRVADALFWMSRYFERAEHVARVLDVTIYQELDLSNLLDGQEVAYWRRQLELAQQPIPDELWAGPDPIPAARAWLSFDRDNPHGIVSFVQSARANARGVRGTIGSDIWRAINGLYWQLQDADFLRHATEAPHDYYNAVETGSHLFQGVCDATLPHDEGWHFIQMGKYLERAGLTIRLLEVKQRQSLTHPVDPDGPMSAVEWAGMLKCCRAYEAYQRLSLGRIDAERVAGFLLLGPNFPRSVRFCLERAMAAIDAIEGRGDHEETRVRRLVGRVLSELRYAEPESLTRGDFRQFLGDLLDRCHECGRAIQEQYSLAR